MTTLDRMDGRTLSLAVWLASLYHYRRMTAFVMLCEFQTIGVTVQLVTHRWAAVPRIDHA